MGNGGIPLDKAELLSVVLEAILYGFSLLMFGGTMWMLFSRRATRKVNHGMLTVACALLLFSTVHLIIHIIRVIEGLIFYRNTYPGGPVAFFADPSQWTFVAKSFIYATQTFIGDGVVLYRCYAVWKNKYVMIVPVLLWCGLVVTGIGSPYMASQAEVIFVGKLFQWITAFWAMALTCNLFTTLLLASRIWYVDRKARRLHGNRRSQLRQVLRVILDAGMIYSFSVFVGLVCYVSQSNGQYVILDMVAPIISITFYMVIVRVGLTKRVHSSRPKTGLPLTYASTENVPASAAQRRTLQVHVSKLTESMNDGGPRTVSYVVPSTIAEGQERRESGTTSEMGLDNKGEAI